MRLTDALYNYPALAARIPPSRWKWSDIEGGADVCTCAYVSGRKDATCTHREPGQVDDGVTFRKPYHNPQTDDPMAVVALKADIDRQLEQLPPLVRKLFVLHYLQAKPWDEVRRILRRPWREIHDCHDHHLARMEARLRHWFPSADQAA
jgi:DNA-directed RNA polymerase specialized sigma24 family protein